jgi:hypothetical protein
VLVGQDVVEEVRGRLRNGKLDLSEYQGMPEMPFHDREKWWMQPHDMSEMQA